MPYFLSEDACSKMGLKVFGVSAEIEGAVELWRSRRERSLP